MPYPLNAMRKQKQEDAPKQPQEKQTVVQLCDVRAERHESDCYSVFLYTINVSGESTELAEKKPLRERVSRVVAREVVRNYRRKQFGAGFELRCGIE